MTETSTPVDQFLAAYTAAVRDADLDAMAALYADDVEVYDAWETWTYRGRDAWRQSIAAWFGSLGDETVAVEFSDVAAAQNGDLAHGHAMVTYAAIAPDGSRLRSLDNRMSVVLRKRDGAWRVVHEHSSSPAAFQTGKVILSRASSPPAS